MAGRKAPTKVPTRKSRLGLKTSTKQVQPRRGAVGQIRRGFIGLARCYRRWLFLVVVVVALLVAAHTISDAQSRLPGPLPNPVIANIKRIYAIGQTRGNRARVFSKVGDSISLSANFLGPVGDGLYYLGEYAYLKPVIDYFSATNARAGNSFNNRSLAAGVGWAAWAMFDPSLADSRYCQPEETPLACEYRVVRPSIALIMLGTNDVGYRSVGEYRSDLLRIVRVSEQMGVIPVLSTIPDRPDVGDKVNEFNAVVIEIARQRNLPVWDYAAAMRLLPNNGLAKDNVHPSSPPNWYDAAADFHPRNLVYGYVVRNLTALKMLYSLWWHLHASAN